MLRGGTGAGGEGSWLFGCDVPEYPQGAVLSARAPPGYPSPPPPLQEQDWFPVFRPVLTPSPPNPAPSSSSSTSAWITASPTCCPSSRRSLWRCFPCRTVGPTAQPLPSTPPVSTPGPSPCLRLRLTHLGGQQPWEEAGGTLGRPALFPSLQRPFLSIVSLNCHSERGRAGIIPFIS